MSADALDDALDDALADVLGRFEELLDRDPAAASRVIARLRMLLVLDFAARESRAVVPSLV